MDPYDGGDAVAVDGGYDATCILTTAGNVLCQGRDTAEDGTCLVLQAGTLRCEGLELLADRRARDDGRVRQMTISVYHRGACYVLDDATAECEGNLVPVLEPEPTGRNEVAVEPRGATLSPPGLSTPSVPIRQETRLVVPVRVCPVEGTCAGYVVVDPGIGPVDAEVPGVAAEGPVRGGARLTGAAVALDMGDPHAVHAAAGIEASACVADACAELPPAA